MTALDQREPIDKTSFLLLFLTPSDLLEAEPPPPTPPNAAIGIRRRPPPESAQGHCLSDEDFCLFSLFLSLEMGFALIGKWVIEMCIPIKLDILDKQ